MKIAIIILVVVLVLSAFCNPFRLFVSMPVSIISYAVKDLWHYFTRYRNIPKKSFIRVYVGLFGQGKTLSAVHDVIEFYNEYNDKMVYDDRQNKFVKQRVFILSNVNLVGVPYRKFTSMQQLINISRWRHIDDKAKGFRTITVVLGDEFSVQMNSRSFRDNLSPLALNAILCSRHAIIDRFYLTSQRFSHMDALLRQVSSEVVECTKIWRYQKNVYYDAYEYENYNHDVLKVKENRAFFVTDELYKSYDTHQVVSQLIKATESGDLIPPDQELRLKELNNGKLEHVKKKTIFGSKEKK